MRIIPNHLAKASVSAECLVVMVKYEHLTKAAAGRESLVRIIPNYLAKASASAEGLVVIIVKV